MHYWIQTPLDIRVEPSRFSSSLNLCDFPTSRPVEFWGVIDWLIHMEFVWRLDTPFHSFPCNLRSDLLDWPLILLRYQSVNVLLSWAWKGFASKKMTRMACHDSPVPNDWTGSFDRDYHVCGEDSRSLGVCCCIVMMIKPGLELSRLGLLCRSFKAFASTRIFQQQYLFAFMLIMLIFSLVSQSCEWPWLTFKSLYLNRFKLILSNPLNKHNTGLLSNYKRVDQ